MDGSIQSSASNRLNHALKGTSNGCEKNPVSGDVGFAEFWTFLMIVREPGEIWGNGRDQQIQRIKKDSLSSRRNV